jgi:hypothetical protein
MATDRLRFFGLLLSGVFFALLLTFVPSGNTAQAQACDPSGSRDGTASPNVVPPNTVVTFTATGFSSGEEASFWFTLPDGNVFGTAAPLCCADETGSVRFEPLTLPQGFYQFPGKWALTVQGASSSHVSVIYFCVVTAVQPTQPPATNTPVPPPPTATTAPPTATTVPPTVEATATTAVSPTVEVSPTALATAEASPTSPTALPTAQPSPTIVVVAPTVEVLPTVEATPVIAGMPITGRSDGGSGDVVLYAVAAFAALNMIALGYFARRKASARR